MEKSLIIDNTPIETYTVDGIDVHVKREDLCTVAPMPPLAIRHQLLLCNIGS